MQTGSDVRLGHGYPSVEAQCACGRHHSQVYSVLPGIVTVAIDTPMGRVVLKRGLSWGYSWLGANNSLFNINLPDKRV